MKEKLNAPIDLPDVEGGDVAFSLFMQYKGKVYAAHVRCTKQFIEDDLEKVADTLSTMGLAGYRTLKKIIKPELFE